MLHKGLGEIFISGNGERLRFGGSKAKSNPAGHVFPVASKHSYGEKVVFLCDSGWRLGRQRHWRGRPVREQDDLGISGGDKS